MYEEVTYEDNNHIERFLIKHYNNFYYDSDLTLYNFILKIKKLIKENKITINYRTLDTKSVQVIDFTTINKIKNELNYSNKSLLYEYINNKLKESDLLNNEDFNNKYNKIFVDIFKEIDNIEIEDNYSLKKLFNSLFNLTTDDNDNIRKIINYLSNSNKKQIYLIFYNSQYLKLEEKDNIYLFDINTYMEKNISILKTKNNIYNIRHKDIISDIEKVLLLSDNKINNYLTIYFTYYISKEKIYINDNDFLNICNYLNNTFTLNKKIIKLVDSNNIAF